ncbi:protein of unknown function [Pararobbsia alpina]
MYGKLCESHNYGFHIIFHKFHGQRTFKMSLPVYRLFNH